MEGRAWWATVHGVVKSRTRLSDFTFTFTSKEHPGLISFRMDWLDLLAVQGTLKSLLQHHTSKASILWCPAFFILQISHPYMTTGKTIALTRQTFVGKVMSLLFNILSRFVIAFLPRSKHLLISWLQSPSEKAPGPWALHVKYLLEGKRVQYVWIDTRAASEGESLRC